jgi:hypothetical protein
LAVDEYRSMCFWNLPEDFKPVTYASKILALDRLEKYGGEPLVSKNKKDFKKYPSAIAPCAGG